MATVVAFIDAQIGDPAAIVDRLPPDADWYVLAADDDGIGQMRRILAGYSDLAAIHVVSHGGEGVLYLGSTTLDSGNLTAYAAALADVGAALSEDGDLLLYGCNVGRGAAGAAFVDALAGATGADVAASSDATGATALGGNWALEVAAGPIEAAALSGGDFAALLDSSVSIAPLQALKPEGIPTWYTFAAIRGDDLSTVRWVHWAVTGSGAHSADAADFGGTLPSGTVTFGIGETNKIIAVSVPDDAAVEFDEGFTITLSNPSPGLIILNGSASGAIQNDDKSMVSIAPLSADKAEGNGGTTPFTFTVSLDQAGVAEQTVGWTVAGSGAHPADAADFGGSLPSGTVTLAAGETSQVVTVLLSGDTAVEFDEGFTVTLSGPSAGLSIGTSSTAAINDNDDTPSISIASLSVDKAEGDVGTTPFTFTVNLDRPGIADQTIDWSVTGSGVHPADAADFGGTLPTGSLTFSAGETDKLVTVQVWRDIFTEFDEKFAVDLSKSSAGLVIGTASATGTIQNDDFPVVSIVPLSADKAEGKAGTTPFTFKVRLDQPGVAPQTVDWSVTGSGAHPADGLDFGGALPAGTVTFAAGETDKLVTVLVLSGSIEEYDEQFFVTLSNASAGLALGTASATGTIRNDDFPTVSIAALSADKAEGDVGTTSFDFTVSLDQPSVANRTVDWSVVGSGVHPADGVDFGGALPAGTVTFAADETVKLLSIPVIVDTWTERDEQFSVILSDPSAGLVLGATSATGTIRNDDFPIISIAALSADKPEGDVGTTSFTFTVSLDQPSVADQTVDWSVTGSGVHPADGLDFGGVLPAGTVTFAAGETTKPVTVLVWGDNVNEADEQFFVTLSNPSTGLVLGTVSATGTIVTDDFPPRFSIAALSAVGAEGNAGTTPFTFTVSLDQSSATDQTVDWSVTGSSLQPADGLDFGGALPAGTLTFVAGETSRTVTVLVSGDMAVEHDEAFVVVLTDPSSGLTIDIASATATVRNDDMSVVSIGPVAVVTIRPTSQADNTKFGQATISLDQAPVEEQSVQWTMAGSGANPASADDFVTGQFPAGLVTFAPAEASKTISFEISDDSTVEPDETFTIQLSNPSSGLTIGTATAEGTIVNDDVAIVSIAALSAVKGEGNAGTTPFTFTVSLDQPSVTDQTVDWSVTGALHQDYTIDFNGELVGTVTFAAGETSTIVTVLVSGDTTFECDEDFTVTLSNASAGLLIANGSANGTIQNDDTTTVSISALSAPKPEGNGGPTSFTFRVEVFDPGCDDKILSWSLAGSGVNGADAADFGGTLPAGTLTFAAGETSKTITVDVAGDTVLEDDETFKVTLSNPSPGLTLGAASAEGTILNDDATVSIAAVSTTGAEGNSGATAFVFKVRMEEEEASHDVVSGSVHWSVAGAGASPAVAVDFLGGVLPSGTITFAPGETVGTITVQAVGDSLVEADEGFTVTLSNPSPGLTLGTATDGGTILNDDATVLIAAIDARKAEGDDGVTFFVASIDLDDFISTRTAQFSLSWQVTGTGPDPADASDFAGGLLPSGTVTFAPGEISKTIAVKVVGDSLVEADEGFTVTPSNPSPGLTLGTASASGTIRNDDWKVTSSWAEDVGDSVILARAVDPDNLPGDWSTIGQFTIIAGNDDGLFEIDSTGGVSLAAGKAFDYETSQRHVLTAGLIDHDGNSVFGPVQVTINIVDAIDVDEPFLALAPAAIEDLARPEGNAGTTAFHYIVTLWGDVDFFPPIVWSVTGSGDHAATASDFAGGVLPGGTVTFAPGETSKTITVEVMGDSLGELDESFKVTLSSPPPGLALGTASAEGTIRNDDVTVSIVAADTVKPEGKSGTTAFTFDVTWSSDDERPTEEITFVFGTIAWSVTGSGDHAATASDFAGGALPSGTVTFAPGETSKTITVEVAGDAVVEPDESFTVTLSAPSPGLTLGTASAEGKILNDDATFSIAAADAVKPEGDTAATAFTFTVTSSESSTICWRVAGSDGSPASASDFAGGVLPSGTVTFAPGETSKTITVEVAGDSLPEADESFTVTLCDPSSGLPLDNASAEGTILNDDLTISIAPTDATRVEGDSGTTSFTFTVTVTSDLGDTATHEVGWWMTGIGPHPADGSDFVDGVLPSGTLTFAAGETSKTITVEVAGDTLVEADETFAVINHDYSGDMQIGGYAQATGTILNDDTTVSIAATDAIKAEGSSGTTFFTFTVTVTIDLGDTSTHEVGYWMTGIGPHPADGSDFAGGVLPTGTLTFAPGETSKTITVEMAGDTAVEADESFSVTLSDPSPGLTIGTGTATGTILNDDATVSISAIDATKVEGDGGTIFFCPVSIDLADPGGNRTTFELRWHVTGTGPSPASASDFVGSVLPTGTLTFAPGETSKTIAVEVAGDTVVEPDEGFTVSLSNASAGLTIGTGSVTGTIVNNDVLAYDDAYVVHQGQLLTVAQSAGVLANDLGASEATLFASPAHGTVQLAADGSFIYTPAAGFFGIDSFAYRAFADEDQNDLVVRYSSIHVVPVLAGETTTLNLLALTAEEQIASTYAAFFGRAADAAGFAFWVDQFNVRLPVQGAAALFANIASSFGISDEAKALYPFLANPFGASDSQVSAFLESVYDNLFDRSSDAAGLAYWTDQVQQTLAAGQFVGSVLVDIMSGAQDTAAGKDITTLMGKVAVSLAYVHEQKDHHTVWAGASDIAAATELLEDVTADQQSVLLGIRNAETLIAGHG